MTTYQILPYLGELALLINESNEVEWPDSDHVQDLLVVLELNVRPHNVLLVILCLLQFEDVAHKELLQVLIAVVDAHLLKAVKREGRQSHDSHMIVTCKLTG